MAEGLSLERRRDSRLPIVIPVELGDERGFAVHSTSDLSVGGAFFARAIPHPVGAQVKVILRPPAMAPFTCRGEVANVPDANDFGMGVRFLDLPEAEQTRLADFIEAADPRDPGAAHR